MTPDPEDEQLRAVALHNARAIQAARVRAEQALLTVQAELRQQSERLRVALAAAQLGDWSWNAADDLVLLSDPAADIFGLPRGAPITWARMRDFLHPADAERARAAVEEALENRADYDVEYRVRKPGGDEAWIAAKGRGAYADDGTVLGMIGVVQDVSERRRVEEALRETADLLRGSFAQAAVGMAISAPDGRLLEVNRRASEMLGYPEDELKAMTAFQFSHPEELADTRADVARLLAGAISHYARERRYVRKDGRVIWSHTSVSLLRGSDGRPHRFVSVLEDITQRKEAEAALQRAVAEAQRLSELKDDFLATLSHELRTPLSAILGWTQVLRHRPTERDELLKALEVIERNARVQTQLIEDLLDMSRITSGKMRLDVQQADPSAFIEAAIATVLPAIHAKGLRLEKTLDPAAGPINGDPARLQQVVWNLLSNAVKFTPRDGKIQVVLQRVNSHIEISVADTGMGIKPAFIGHVFERFRQADASTTREHGGLGLGLSIAKHLVELHGGSVRAQSAGEGRGTTFTVSLPLAAVQGRQPLHRVHPRAPGEAPDYRLADLSGLRFLVVDDEPDARSLVERVLTDCGGRVVTAASAEEALTALPTLRPQALLCDIGMPGMDGYELVRRIRAMPEVELSLVPAIALTAFARSEDRTKALRAGFNLHLAKPVEPAELVATVASVAGRPK